MPHFDLLIRNGTAVLPWGEVAADIGVLNGRIAAIGASGTADETIDATGLHVLPGLIDPHVHLRDPGDPAIETIPTGTKAAVLGGLTAVFDMPNTSPAITSAERVAWKQGYVEGNSWCDIGLYVGATKANTPELAELETLPGVCAIKVFAGSSTGDLLIEDDASLEAVMRSGRRPVAYHSEDEYRLQDRRPMFHSGMPYRSHMEWRDEECAMLGTRRLMALARKTGRPTHILHVSTAGELELLRGYKDIATAELLVNHLTQWAPDVYDKLGGFGVMNPPIRGREHWEAAWAAVRDGTADTIGSDHAPHPRAAKLKPWPEVPGRADRGADAGAGDAGPRERRAAEPGPYGGFDVRRPGPGLRRGRQGPHRRRLRRRFHAGGHEAPPHDRGFVDRDALRLDPVRRHANHRLAGGNDRARADRDAG